MESSFLFRYERFFLILALNSGYLQQIYIIMPIAPASEFVSTGYMYLLDGTGEKKQNIIDAAIPAILVARIYNDNVSRFLINNKPEIINSI